MQSRRKSELIEKGLIDEIVRESQVQGLTHSGLAKIAYGDEEGSPVKWRGQRRPGEPRKLSITEAHQLAQALSMRLSDLIFRAETKIISQS